MLFTFTTPFPAAVAFASSIDAAYHAFTTLNSCEKAGPPARSTSPKKGHHRIRVCMVSPVRLPAHRAYARPASRPRVAFLLPFPFCAAIPFPPPEPISIALSLFLPCRRRSFPTIPLVSLPGLLPPPLLIPRSVIPPTPFGFCPAHSLLPSRAPSPPPHWSPSPAVVDPSLPIPHPLRPLAPLRFLADLVLGTPRHRNPPRLSLPCASLVLGAPGLTTSS